jgi:hypothetical protein
MAGCGARSATVPASGWRRRCYKSCRGSPWGHRMNFNIATSGIEPLSHDDPNRYVPAMDAIVAYFAKPETVFEITKLIAQLGGALLIAWLAVQWALNRFKSEKTWERGITAFADTVSALREMNRVYGIWLDHYFKQIDFGEKGNARLTERLQQAMRKFGEASSA